MEQRKNYPRRPGEHVSALQPAAGVIQLRTYSRAWLLLRHDPGHQAPLPLKEDQVAALKRHLVFFNTTPAVCGPVIGVTAAMEEAGPTAPLSTMAPSTGSKLA